MNKQGWQIKPVFAIGALCLLMNLSAAAAGKASAVARPNVVIMFTDDQGTLDAHCYGSTDLYTPTMDKLAATGVRFTQAYSHTVCCPARAMLMTGRHPQRSGVNNWTQSHPLDQGRTVMDSSEVTLAEALRDAGYKTALFGKWHLGADFEHGPPEQGFDRFFGHRGGFIDNYQHIYMHGKGFHDLYEGNKEVFRNGEYFPDMITARALEYIGENRSNPFFLYLAFNIPHYPEQADPKFDDRYKNMEMPRQSYAKMVSTVDDRMGQVLRKLDALGLRENTIVIFQSDNGYSGENYQIKHPDHASGLPVGHNYGPNSGGGNTGKWIGKKGTFFEGGIRVPCIVSYPSALPQGVVRDQAITVMDWMPTVLGLCGVQRPDLQFDGHNILPIINENRPSLYQAMHWQWGTQWAVRENGWKLIRGKKSALELYNLGGDQPEQKDHADTHPEIVDRLQRMHDEWARDVMTQSDRVLFALPKKTDAGGLTVHHAKSEKNVWLFTGQKSGLEADAADLAPLVGNGFNLTVDFTVNQCGGTLFEWGGGKNRVALYLKDRYLWFALTANGKTETLRSPDPFVPMPCSVTAAVKPSGQMYLISRNMGRGSMPGPGLLAGVPPGRMHVGDGFSGRLKKLEISMPHR